MADQTAQAGADPSVNGSTDGQPFRVFNSQQEFDAFAAGIRAAAERKARNLSADEKAAFDAMQAELEQRKARDLEAAGNYDKAKAALQQAADAKIKAAEDRLAKANAVAHRALVDAQLRTLATQHGAYSADDVTARLGSRVTLDDDYNVVILDVPGGKPLDGITLDQAVQDLLKANPHLVKASGGRGAGSAGGASLMQPVTGTPSQRDLQAKIADLKVQIAKNPRATGLGGQLLALQAQLKASQTA